MNPTKLFSFINATAFFPKFCKHITSWKHKLRGKNGRGNPCEFSPEELDQIQVGIDKIKAEFAVWRQKAGK